MPKVPHALREIVHQANLRLARTGLVTGTFGNVSAVDRKAGLFVIKPSGVPYEDVTPERTVAVSLETGETIESDLRPSSDAPTHLEIYRAFAGVTGVAHTHSVHATVWAQAGMAIPCLGTTHADHFHGPVPVTRALSEAEVAGEYEVNTGRVIVERFAGFDPTAIPAVLVAGHGPFTWGADAGESVQNAVALEAVAEMALGTLRIDPNAPALEPYILEKHHQRKHGRWAYYGQK